MHFLPFILHFPYGYETHLKEIRCHPADIRIYSESGCLGGHIVLGMDYRTHVDQIASDIEAADRVGDKKSVYRIA